MLGFILDDWYGIFVMMFENLVYLKYFFFIVARLLERVLNFCSERSLYCDVLLLEEDVNEDEFLLNLIFICVKNLLVFGVLVSMFVGGVFIVS